MAYAQSYPEVRRSLRDDRNGRGLLRLGIGGRTPHKDKASGTPKRGKAAKVVKRVRCGRCGKLGHMSRQCPQKAQAPSAASSTSGTAAPNGRATFFALRIGRADLRLFAQPNRVPGTVCPTGTP